MRPPITPCEIQSWQMSDSYVVQGRVWPQRGQNSRAAIIYLHGIQSHGGWFEWSASLLARAGAMVVMPDRRGSGLNDAARGDTPNCNRWLEDLDDLAARVEEEYGVSRFAVVGVSWGGKLAAAWALRHPQRVQHLLLVAPGLFAQVAPTMPQRIGIAASLVVRPTRPHKIPLDDPALFTDNPAGRDFIDRDPLKLTRATARFLFNSVVLDRRLRRNASGSLRARTTLALAERERIIHNNLTEQWLCRACASAPAIKRFPAAHTIEFEQDTTAYAEFLTRWADEVASDA